MQDAADKKPAHDADGLSHLGVARRHWPVIAVTLSLLVVENVIRVLEPYLLGRAIDGLIARTYAPLGVLVAASLAGLAIGVGRRLFDTRGYGRIYRLAASETALREASAARPVTQIVARIGFVQEFADFFEQMLPAALMSLITLVGAVVMLGVLSPLLCAATLSATTLIAAVFVLSSRRISWLNGMLNDEMERQVDVLSAADAPGVSAHFRSVVRWRIALSDLEARNFGIVIGLTILLTALAAYIMVVVEERTEGQVFAALTYVLQFTESVIILPYTYQTYVRTRQISARLTGAQGPAAGDA